MINRDLVANGVSICGMMWWCKGGLDVIFAKKRKNLVFFAFFLVFYVCNYTFAFILCRFSIIEAGVDYEFLCCLMYRLVKAGRQGKVLCTA